MNFSDSTNDNSKDDSVTITETTSANSDSCSSGWIMEYSSKSILLLKMVEFTAFSNFSCN